MSHAARFISILTPCFNEEENLHELYTRVRAAMQAAGPYIYEHIFIDNASTDRSLPILRELAAADPRVKVIVNTRNFGGIRSPHHALMQTRGEAVIGLCADLQDPPELIPEMLRVWESGTPVVIGVVQKSEEGGLRAALRRCYYQLLKRWARVETYENFTGFGLYDRKVVEALKKFPDPYPYFRGLIAEMGFPRHEIPFHKPLRKHGTSKHNYYALYDWAMVALTNFSRVPLRLVTFAGFASAAVCALVAAFYLVYKLLFWEQFTVGIAPVVIGIFFCFSVQLVFLGILGEYVGAILTYVQRRPLVFERERINFENDADRAIDLERLRAGLTAMQETAGITIGNTR